MKGTLHILKSPPHKLTKTLLCSMDAWTSQEDEIFHLYDKEPDYGRLLDLIFTYDRNICWW